MSREADVNWVAGLADASERQQIIADVKKIGRQRMHYYMRRGLKLIFGCGLKVCKSEVRTMRCRRLRDQCKPHPGPRAHIVHRGPTEAGVLLDARKRPCQSSSAF